MITQEEWEEEQMIRIEGLVKKYEVELNKYNLIKECDLDDLKPGGYVKYINYKDELKFGGILINKFINKNKLYLTLSNNNYKYTLSFNRNIIFYLKNRTTADKLREIFISSLEKYKDDYD